MILPPAFLEDVRSRVALAALIGRKTRLVKKGREWMGLCPFHNEKSPSFSVNEDKGFFHCFGCGAHGDAIEFVRRADNRSFQEAVELLAAEAGLEMPKPTPAAREEARRQASLYEVMEAACAFYEAQLDTVAGRAALAYLDRRGLDRDTAKRFRLGFAPPGSGLLLQHMAAQFPIESLIEAGLAMRREPSETDRRDGSFDYFRDRVMFPIFDRRDRVIAFGGRVTGDGKPKYLNSPETPVFHKGSVLYGLSWARAGVGKGASLIVTEGYMDVIALHRAGFAGAVAPLGTALTEQQLEEVWKLVPTPILCFDGDGAGQRAAVRALERALPQVNAERSLRFATLPAGEDPDSLLRGDGRDAMQGILDRAQPLSEFLWSLELAQGSVDTPERRADLSARLAQRVKPIADETLRREYLSFFRTCQFERLRPARKPKAGGRRNGRGGFVADLVLPAPPDPQGAARRARMAGPFLIALHRPELIDVIAEAFAGLDFHEPRLDSLRQEILNVHESDPAIDAGGMHRHLSERGYADEIAALGSDRLLKLLPFVLSPDRELVLAGWQDILTRWQTERSGKADVDAAVERFERDPESALRSLQALAVEGERRRLGHVEVEGSDDIV